ncbi:MAG: hypothetical protein LBC53_04415, partial [Spirochaetaceae bacterium]|nr:hypothetical protein [Spirochaetaceae bacterium]
MPDYFLTQDIADALCTVITLGYAKKKEKAGKPVTFEYSFYNKENPPDVNKDAIAEERDYQLLQDVLGHRGLNIQVRMS